jgi:hypothetical protein
MEVTTKRSVSDTRQRIRQLEVAIEHAQAAASTVFVDGEAEQVVGNWMVEVSYPSFELRETMKALLPHAERGGMWVVIELNNPGTAEACKAACTVLHHYYPDEKFVVRTVPIILAS